MSLVHLKWHGQEPNLTDTLDAMLSLLLAQPETREGMGSGYFLAIFRLLVH